MNFVFMIGKVISKPYILSANNIQKATSYFSIEVEMNELKNSYRIDKFSIVVHGALAIYIKENLVIGDTLILQGYIKNRELKNSGNSKRTISEIVAEYIRIIKNSDESTKNKPFKIIKYDDDIPEFLRVNSDPEWKRTLDEAPY